MLLPDISEDNIFKLKSLTMDLTDAIQEDNPEYAQGKFGIEYFFRNLCKKHFASLSEEEIQKWLLIFFNDFGNRIAEWHKIKGEGLLAKSMFTSNSVKISDVYYNTMLPLIKDKNSPLILKTDNLSSTLFERVSATKHPNDVHIVTMSKEKYALYIKLIIFIETSASLFNAYKNNFVIMPILPRYLVLYDNDYLLVRPKCLSFV